MTGSDKNAVKTFLLLLVFFGAVMLVFFYTAKKEIHEQVQVMVPASSQKAPMISWEQLRDLKDDEKVEIRANGARVTAEVVRSGERQQQGLSGKENLAEGEGMVFVFDGEETRSFWNKDMNFPIDVLWLARGKVVGVSSLPVFSGRAPIVVTAPAPVDVVLEVPEGFADKYAIMVENNISFYETK